MLQHEQYDKDHDLLSDLRNGNPVIHDDFWSSYGLPLYDSSRAPSVYLDLLDVPCSKITFRNPSPPPPYMDLPQHEIGLCQPYLPFPEANSVGCLPILPLISCHPSVVDCQLPKISSIVHLGQPLFPLVRVSFQFSIQGVSQSNLIHLLHNFDQYLQGCFGKLCLIKVQFPPPKHQSKIMCWILLLKTPRALKTKS